MALADSSGFTWKGRLRKNSMTILITCEHAGNRVPDTAVDCFQSPAAQAMLRDARGFDPGALDAARILAESLDCPLISYPFSRLVVDVNRSLRNPRLFSSLTKSLSAEKRKLLLDRYYHPYRQRLVTTIQRMLKHNAFVMHLAVHSFPPFVNGKPKRADVGILYDPSQDDERDLCLDWAEEIYFDVHDLRVRRNYPCRGTADRLPRFIRQETASPHYLGIELQLNQAWCRRRLPIRDQTLRRLAGSLQAVLETSPQHQVGAA